MAKLVAATLVRTANLVVGETEDHTHPYTHTYTVLFLTLRIVYTVHRRFNAVDYYYLLARQVYVFNGLCPCVSLSACLSVCAKTGKILIRKWCNLVGNMRNGEIILGIPMGPMGFSWEWESLG